MSHYDCKSCGHIMGIDYGFCEKCTPKIVFDLEKQLKHAEFTADNEWKKLTKQARNAFIELHVGQLRTQYQETLEEHRPKS